MTGRRDEEEGGNGAPGGVVLHFLGVVASFIPLLEMVVDKDEKPGWTREGGGGGGGGKIGI